MRINIKENKWHALLIALVIIQFIPLVFMLSTSFKSMEAIFSNPLDIIPDNITFDNYKYIIENVEIGKYLMNTFFIATAVTIGKLILSVLAAYVFVYKDFKGKNIVYTILILTIFIPFTVIMIPNYLTMSELGLLNSPLGVILPQFADAMGIFLIRQHMRTIPKSLIEVGKLEDMKDINILRRIVFPLVKNSAMSMGIIFFINSWNEYFWPMLILTDKGDYTLSLALQMFISAEGGNEWGVAMALAALTILVPIILYIICQKFIISTFMNSGVKG